MVPLFFLESQNIEYGLDGGLQSDQRFARSSGGETIFGRLLHTHTIIAMTIDGASFVMPPHDFSVSFILILLLI